MQKKWRRADWNYSWMTLGFSCIVFGLHYPNVLLKSFLLSQLVLLCSSSLWEAVTLSEGSWLCPSTLPLLSALSGHVPLRTAWLLGSGFLRSSRAPGSRAWACCMQARAGAGRTRHHFLSANSPKAERFASPFIQSILHCPVLSICCLIDLHTLHRLTWLPTRLRCSEKCKLVGSILVLLVSACNYTTSSVLSVLAQLLMPDL